VKKMPCKKKKKWSVPEDWGTYKPDLDEKGFNPPFVQDALKKLAGKK